MAGKAAKESISVIDAIKEKQMINIVSCDACIHSKVCGKKDTYEKFVNEVEKISISL